MKTKDIIIGEANKVGSGFHLAWEDENGVQCRTEGEFEIVYFFKGADPEISDPIMKWECDDPDTYIFHFQWDLDDDDEPTGIEYEVLALIS